MPLSGYPDGQPTSRPNQFASNIVGTTSTGSIPLAFGFNAGLMKLSIDGGGPVFISLDGNPASTQSYKLTSGDLLTDWYDVGIPWAGINYFQGTSTALQMRIGAWG